MKRTTLKLFSLLLAAIMILALIPVASFAEGESSDRDGRADFSDIPETTNYGYRRTPSHGTRAVSDAYARGDMETYYRLSGIQPKRDTLPSSYDSRSVNGSNYVTSVKNQNPYGSCWAHAAMASVESYMIKHGVKVGSTGSVATTSLNLSETQHCFFNYSYAYDAEGMLTGDKTTLLGSDSCLDSGGNGEMSAYTLQSWVGAASEGDATALQYSKASTVASSGLDSQYSYRYDVCHVQNSEWIPATNIEGVKRAIMEYGAGNISYYAGNSTPTYNCTIDTSSQDSSSHKWANHAITLIGWDDSIAASKFSPNKPSGNGAWLCKNSWGTSYFDGGYMWISYEDTSVLEGYIYFYDAQPIDNYDHNYQYDGTCNPVPYGSGNRTGFANNTKVANVFTAKGSESLEAVGFCSWDEALSYTLEIYKNPTTGNPSSGTLMNTQTGTLTYSGYYTIPLETPVALAAGDTFSVVFTQSVPEADSDGKYVHTPYDANFYDTSVVSWAKWEHANHGNTSYYKEPNGNWTDCPDNGDYRIKAYTDDLKFVVTAVSNNTAWGTVTVSGTKITATPANGYYVSDYEVVSGTATATINGNIINVAPSTDCTIRIIFAPKPTYTVNYRSSGALAGSVSAQIYDVISLPASVSNTPDGWTFIGWSASTVAETTAMPEFYEPGAEYTVTANATLYALYTRVEETGGDIIYQQTDELAVGGRYAIAVNSYAVKNTVYNTSNNHYVNAQTVTINSSDNTLTVAASVNINSILYVIESGSASDGWVFKNVENGQYLTLTSDEYLTVGTSSLAWLYQNGDLNNQIDSEGYYYLSYNSDKNYFTTSKNTSGSVKLYREVSPAITYYSTNSTGYYLIGSMTGWAVDPDLKFEPNPSNSAEYMLPITLAAGDEFKAVKAEGTTILAWYPDQGTNYVVGANQAGDVTVYFRPDGQGGDGWHYGYLYIAVPAPEEPAFMTQSLALEGQIAVNFFVKLPVREGYAYQDVTFAISSEDEGAEKVVPYSTDLPKNSKGYYRFTCYVRSIQMADMITATLHYTVNGAAQTLVKEYSVKEYFETYDEYKALFSDEEQNLTEALADFGYYVQAYLDSVRDWNVPDDYAKMDKRYTTYGETERSEAQTQLNQYQIVRNTSTDITKITFSLHLDSDTAIQVFFTPAKSYTGTPTFTLDGNTVTAELQSDGRYMVEIPNIPAHELSKTHEILVTTENGTATVRVSGLSYAKAMLDAYANNELAVDAAVAIYRYSKCADALFSSASN